MREYIIEGSIRKTFALLDIIHVSCTKSYQIQSNIKCTQKASKNAYPVKQ